MTNEYVTWRCLSIKIDELSDVYEELYHGGGRGQDALVNNMIFMDLNPTEESRKRSRRQKIRRGGSHERQNEWETLCHLLMIVDLIMYKRTGYVSEFLYMNFDSDEEMNRAAEYDFNAIISGDRIEFTYNYEIEYPDRFKPTTFQSQRFVEDGVQFLSYRKVDGKNEYVCRVSISKEGFSEIAAEIIDSGELDALDQKNIALF